MTERLASLVLCAAVGACSSVEIVGTPNTPVWSIQGDSKASPLEGQTITVTGIVTGDFQSDEAQRRLGGFFLQAETPDADPETSDGVFVYDGAAPAVDVTEGDVVVVTGQVVERFGETQITADSVTVTGSGSVRPLDILLPAGRTTENSTGNAITDFEHVEGMLVRLPQSLTVTELYDLERFGEILLSSDGRLVHFTNADRPSVKGYARIQEQHILRSLRLDDGSSMQNVTPVRYLRPHADPESSVRIGDRVSYLVGNIRYSRGSGGFGSEAYRLVPMDNPQFETVNPRPSGSPSPGGTLTVASFNVQNFFSNIDTGERICGPAGNSNCRGANSTAEYDRQLAKIVSALAILDADIVGLTEIENQGNTALRTIVDALNAASGTGNWSFVDTGILGGDAIRNGFIYQSATVEPAGQHAVIDTTVDVRFRDGKNRPSVAQTFRHVASGGALTVVVHHLKSKGSACDDVDDPDLEDGQANCNQTRSAAAAAIVDWLAQDPTHSGDSDFLIIGDLNAYLQEDPVAEIEAGGYANLLRAFSGAGAYSFVFKGESGALDHALASPTLLGQVRGVMEWHINADEPPLFDYQLDFGRNPDLFDAATPFRASDHDPVVIGLELR